MRDSGDLQVEACRIAHWRIALSAANEQASDDPFPAIAALCTAQALAVKMDDRILGGWTRAVAVPPSWNAKEHTVDVRQLRYFIAVVDQGGFVKGAASLFVSQPTLSQTIATLEKELGAKLFHRTPHGAVLTGAGEALVPRAQDVLNGMESARAAVSAVAGISVGELNIAVMPALASEPVGTWVARYRRRHPGMVVRLHRLGGSAASIHDQLTNGRHELCVSHLRGTFPGISAVAVGTEQIMAVLPPDSPVMSEDPLPLDYVAGLPLIGTAPHTSLRQVVDEGFAACGAAPEYVVETRFLDSFPPLIMGGAGAAMLPEQYALRIGKLGAKVVPTDPPVYRDYGVYHLKGQVSPAAASFIEIARTKPE